MTDPKTVKAISGATASEIFLLNTLCATFYKAPGEAAHNKMTLHLETLPSGLYTVHIRTETGTATRKLQIVN